MLASFDLNTMRSLLRSQRSALAYAQLLDRLPNYRFKAGAMSWRGDGRPCLIARLADHDANTVELRGLCEQAYRQNTGLAIYAEDLAGEGQLPDLDLSFGSVWSYLAHEHLGGPREQVEEFRRAAEIAPLSPLDALAEPSDEVSVAMMSARIMPEAVYAKLLAEIAATTPGADPHCYVYQRFSHVATTSVVAVFGTPTTQAAALAALDKVKWLMPPFLPLAHFERDDRPNNGTV